MATVPLATLILNETKEKLYSTFLAVASAIGLPVSSWQAGDPTRATFYAEAEALEARDVLIGGYVRSGFLDHAEEPWLSIHAEQQFGIAVPGATFAATQVVLTNNGGGFFPDIAAGDLTFKSSLTGKTYTNTSGGTLASGPGTTLTVDVVADEAGSESSAGAGEIDEMVTHLRQVTCSNPTSAVGVDKQEPETIRRRCRAARGRLSPNGPRDAYTDVALDHEVTGTSNVTDARSFGDSDTGDVTVYLRGPSGAVAEADRLLVEEAIIRWTTPLCITPTVLSVAAVPVAVTYELWVYRSANKTAAEIEEDVEAALEQLLARRPIGGDIVPPAATGKLYVSLIESAIRGTFAQAFRVEVSSPGDVALANGEVAVLGAVTATIHIVKDPT
jgi:phage-related baseplate assembly protein